MFHTSQMNSMHMLHTADNTSPLVVANKSPSTCLHLVVPFIAPIISHPQVGCCRRYARAGSTAAGDRLVIHNHVGTMSLHWHRAEYGSQKSSVVDNSCNLSCQDLLFLEDNSKIGLMCNDVRHLLIAMFSVSHILEAHDFIHWCISGPIMPPLDQLHRNNDGSEGESLTVGL